jgi:hypothetical protein
MYEPELTYEESAEKCTFKMDTFTKDDSTKSMFSLIEPDFLEGIAKVMTLGAHKYSPNNWKLIHPSEKSRYKDALLRHINEYMKGNILDEETHHSHLYHAACNLMFLDYFDKRRHL